MFWNLNFIAVEIEHPFGHDPNDLDGKSMQESFNSQLILLLMDDAWRLPTLSENLKASLSNQLRNEAEGSGLVTLNATFYALGRSPPQEEEDDDEVEEMLRPNATLSSGGSWAEKGSARSMQRFASARSIANTSDVDTASNYSVWSLPMHCLLSKEYSLQRKIAAGEHRNVHRSSFSHKTDLSIAQIPEEPLLQTPPVSPRIRVTAMDRALPERESRRVQFANADLSDGTNHANGLDHEGPSISPVAVGSHDDHDAGKPQSPQRSGTNHSYCLDTRSLRYSSSNMVQCIGTTLKS
jgi:hypothetical protein